MSTAAPTTAAPPTGLPKLYRRPERALVGGVSSGIAEHLGIRRRVVRFAFVVLAFAGGLGVALYAAYWIVLPVPPDSKPPRLPWLAYVVGGVVVVGTVISTVQAAPTAGLFVPTLLACIGGALIWRQASEPERGRLITLSRRSLTTGWDRVGRARLAAGVVFVVAGAVSVLARADVTAVRDGVIAVVVTVVGLALITGPWWMRIVGQLTDERAERIRSQERAEIAAHLHDSVLQTLALIQRNASSPREVARLARGQERELRTMLYGDRTASGQFTEQVRAAAAEVEDAYAITVEVVVVGDAAQDEKLAAVTAAAREALVNTAKHAGVASVSLYAEAEPAEVAVFVKDRGAGFELDEIAEDRQGVRGSIIGRVERHGGQVRVTTSKGAGTEVEIRMPR